MSFTAGLRQISRKHESLLCVGLDSDPARLPASIRDALPPDQWGHLGLSRFNQAIIAETAGLVCAYKLNLAFYLAAGPGGLQALQETLAAIPAGIPAILDLKCGDIQNTAEQYARACFEQWGCQAVTVNPLMGYDAVVPFLRYRDHGTFVLCLTSNPGAADFERQAMADGRPLYQHIAERVRAWAVHDGCGVVVAPVAPEILQELRALLPDLPFLIPGLGTQGHDLELAVRNGVDRHGELAVINVSRAIIYASGAADFAQAAGRVARQYREEINRYR